MRKRVGPFFLVLAACGGGNDPAPVQMDAAMPDAPTVKVRELASCPSTVSATVVDSNTAFIPMMTNINAGQVVKFMINAEHSVIPNTLTTTDPVLMVNRGQTKCFRFDVAGTYGFACGVHGFAGTIVVK